MHSLQLLTIACQAPRKSRGVNEVSQENNRHPFIRHLPSLVRKDLYNYTTQGIKQSTNDVAIEDCPDISHLRVYTYPSARAVFFAPSDLSGIEGMKAERIRAVNSWYRKPRYDCVLVGHSDEPGLRGYNVARVMQFFSFKHEGIAHECALVHWFSIVGNEPCPNTGMWVVKPDFYTFRGVKEPLVDVISIEAILRSVHLIGVAGRNFLPTRGLDFSQSLDAFKAFYVNKYADHHANETVF
jgi:hypothetical protein